MLLAAAPGSAAGWSQWGGPNRDFKAPSTGLAALWPEAGPRELWSRPLGDGYSAIVVDGGTLYTMYRPLKGLLATMAGTMTRTEDPEVVAAIDAESGKTVWEHVYPAPLLPQMGMEYGPGPHSTPLVVDDLVYAVGVTGKLHALDKKTGRVAWSHDLWQEMGGTKQGRGYACSPIAYGSTIILMLGGAGQGLAAFDQKTGRVAWKNGGFAPSPSSPILIDVDGQEQLVVFHADGVAGLDPRNGHTYWSQPHQTDYGLNISTPVSVLARPDAQGLHIQSKAQVLSNRSWTAPTLVGTKLYLRDRVHIKALELS